MNQTPHSLLCKLRQPAGAAAATDWERFVELFTPLLAAWALRLTRDPHSAADLVQDVFVILVRKLPDFATAGAIATRPRRRPPPFRPSSSRTCQAAPTTTRLPSASTRPTWSSKPCG
jgi:hypothetical protein